MWQDYNVYLLDTNGRQVLKRVHAKTDWMARIMAAIMWPEWTCIAVVDEGIV